MSFKIFSGKKINIFLFSLSRDRIKLFVFGLREGKNKENFVFYSFPPYFETLPLPLGPRPVPYLPESLTGILR